MLERKKPQSEIGTNNLGIRSGQHIITSLISKAHSLHTDNLCDFQREDFEEKLFKSYWVLIFLQKADVWAQV